MSNTGRRRKHRRVGNSRETHYGRHEAIHVGRMVLPRDPHRNVVVGRSRLVFRGFFVVFFRFFVCGGRRLRLVVRLVGFVFRPVFRRRRGCLHRVGRPVAVVGRGDRSGMCRIYGTRGHRKRCGHQTRAGQYVTEFHGRSVLSVSTNIRFNARTEAPCAGGFCRAAHCLVCKDNAKRPPSHRPTASFLWCGGVYCRSRQSCRARSNTSSRPASTPSRVGVAG